MFRFSYNYLYRSAQAGALSGFVVGFSMCDVAEKPLIIEKLVAGSLLGIMYGVSFPFIPIAILHNFDKKYNGRYDGKTFDLWKKMYETTTGIDGFTLYTDEEKNKMSKPFPIYTPDELLKGSKCGWEEIDENKNINHPSIPPLTGEELKEMRERINKKK